MPDLHSGDDLFLTPPWLREQPWTGQEGERRVSKLAVGSRAAQKGALHSPGHHGREPEEPERRPHRQLSYFKILLRAGPLPREADQIVLPIPLEHRQQDPLSKTPISC